MTGYDSKRQMAADKVQEREALKLAVDGLEKILHTFAKDGKVVMSSMIRNELFAEVNSLLQQAKASLAQPAQEPVALVIDGVLVKSELPEKYTGHLYTTPPKREWIGMTDEQKMMCWSRATCHADVEHKTEHQCLIDYASEIEAKLKEKNYG